MELDRDAQVKYTPNMLQTREDKFSKDLQGPFLLPALTPCAPALSSSLTTHSTDFFGVSKMCRVRFCHETLIRSHILCLGHPFSHSISIAFPGPITVTQAHLHQVESMLMYVPSMCLCIIFHTLSNLACFTAWLTLLKYRLSKGRDLVYQWCPLIEHLTHTVTQTQSFVKYVKSTLT